MTATDTQEQRLERNFRERVGALSSGGAADADLDQPVRDGSRLTGRMAVAVFDAMVTSRNLDLAARYLRAEGPGVYTIGSAGHESNAAIAAALDRPTRHSSTTARAASIARGRSRSLTQPHYATSSSAWSPPRMSRCPAGATRCSATTSSP